MASIPSDDIQIAGATERAAWASGIVAIVSIVFYAMRVVPQLTGLGDDGFSIDSVSWVPSMLIAIGIGIVGTIVAAIISSIAGAVSATVKGLDPEIELNEDQRDKDIKTRARAVSYGFYGTAAAVTMVLAMLDVASFWIGSAVFAIGTLATVAESTAQLISYRRGLG